MHGDPAAAPDTNGTDLSFFALHFGIDPNTGFTFRPTGVDPIISKRENDRLLQPPQVMTDVSIEFLKIENRIADDLVRPMKCNITSPVCPEKFYAFLV